MHVRAKACRHGRPDVRSLWRHDKTQRYVRDVHFVWRNDGLRMNVSNLPLFTCKHCGRRVAMIYRHITRYHFTR